ncbi:MAG: PfkB family carbohydrate kinase [Candidatus Sedimenticola sp. 6PFRAG7]
MRILAVGIATLDIINTVDAYPGEDQEVRASQQRLSRGGNATNTLVVLSQLGQKCDWAGVLADDPDSSYLVADLNRYNIDLGCCEAYPGGKTPTSYVSLSAATGSRTIVHYRDLPEYSAAAFEKVALEDYDWVHFEGRNVPDLALMLQRAKANGVACSLEIEKPRAGIEELFGLPDVLLFSRAYAVEKGYDQPADFLRSVQPLISRGGKVFLAWGEEGGAALDADGRFCSSPAFAPGQVVDTLGAGDVFNAGVIHALLCGSPVEQALEAACRLAGKKCGQEGLDGLDHE